MGRKLCWTEGGKSIIMNMHLPKIHIRVKEKIIG